MKKHIIVLTLFICSVAIASPIRSINGVRHIGFGEQAESSPNPYITDGLIAMWDGEWNIGFWSHDAAAKVWIDLTGNGFDILTDGTGVSWGENFIYLYFTKVGTFLPRENRPSFTVQCISSTTYINQGAYVWMKNPDSNAGVLMGWTTDGVYYFPWKEIYRDNKKFSIHSWSLSWSSSVQRLMMDGEVIKEMYATVDNRNILSEIRLGEYNGKTVGNMTCYCIRLYNRQLTEEEVAFNAAIDKERFSIP